jgi:hypothetical protein
LSPAELAVDGGLNCGTLPPSAEMARSIVRLPTAATAMFMGSAAPAAAAADIDPSLWRDGNGDGAGSGSDGQKEGERGGGGKLRGLSA